MFGLMRAKKCRMTPDERHLRRLNYCGTCKTIGSMYSSRARVLLDHDVVFLAEVLSSLSGDNGTEWQRAYQSFNCLSLPDDARPASLEWAAAANVILAKFKVADHAADGDGLGYRAAGRFFASDFGKAARFLENNDFPLSDVADVLASQASREADAGSLDDLAFPTAHTTAMFFREGVRHIGRGDLAGSAFELGFAFGKLIYLIDAFEDYEKDVRTGRFNAFRAIYKLEEKSLSGAVKRKIRAIITQVGDEVQAKIGLLPVSSGQCSLFAARLSENLHRKLGDELAVIPKRHVCVAGPKQTFGERWGTAYDKARELARSYSWQMPLVFTFVLVFALVTPAAQLRETRSARECFDLGFNLMFLGTLFGSVLALPKKLLMAVPNEVKEEAAKQAVKKGGGGCCGSIDCDCCDGCGDCCDCCDCCTSCDC
ncbi:MAG TPA: DUF5685 family protein [Pyrinomonadaceae bacterium]|nr:DUF5685 family protein [Pyrinomonadaceae bacterium]